MGVRLIVNANAEAVGVDAVAMYDSVTGWAFGPVFRSVGDAESFIEWLPEDARTYDVAALSRLHSDWVESGGGD